MSDRILGTLVVRLVAELKQYARDWQEAGRTTEQGAQRVEQAGKGATTAVDALTDAAARNGGAMGVMAGQAREAATAVSAVTGVSATALAGVAALAAGVGALGYAVHEGAKEQRALQDSLLLTGNYAGLVTGQLDQMAVRLASNIGGTVSASREVLQGLVQSGRFTTESLESVGKAVQLVARYSGQTNDQVLKHFVSMADGVTKWAEKTNEAYHFLNIGTYDYIKQLEEQGQRQEAARVASEALSSHLGGDLAKNLGIVERLWQSVTSKVSEYVDKIKSIGRDDRQAEIDAIDRKIEEMRASRYGQTPKGQEEIAAWEQARSTLQNLLDVERIEAQVRSDDSERVERQITGRKAWSQILKENRSDAQRLADELKRVREAATAAGNVSETELAEQLRRTEERFNRKVPAAKTAVDPYDVLIRQAQSSIAVLEAEAAATEKLTAGEKKLATYLEDVKNARIPYNERGFETIGLLQKEIMLEKQARQAASDAKQGRENADETAKAIEASEKSAARIQDEADKLRLHTAQLGLNKVATAELTAAKLDDTAATKERLAAIIQAANPERAASLLQEAAAYRTLAAARREAASKEAALDAIKEQERAWAQFGNWLERTLETSLQHGFDHGKGFVRNFFDSLKITGEQTVIRIGVQGTLGYFGLPTSGAGGALNVGALLGNAGSSFAGTAAAGAFGSSFAPLAGAGSLLGIDAIGAGAASLAEQSAINAALGSAASGSTLASVAAAIPGWGWGLLAATAVLGGGMLGKGGGPKSDGRYGYINSGIASGQYDSQLAASVQAIQAQYDTVVKQLGGTGGLKFGAGVSMDPKGSSPTFVDVTASRDGQTVFTTLDRGVGRDEASAQAAVTRYLQEAMVRGLQQADIRGKLADELRGLGDVAAMSADQLAQVTARIAKASQERAALEERLFQASATAEEKRLRALQQERAAMDSSNAALLAEVQARERLQQLGSDLMTAYNRESGSLSQDLDTLRSLRDDVVGGVAGQSLAAAKARLRAIASGTGQGDIKSATDDYLQLLKASASSRAEYLSGVGDVLSMIDGKASMEQQQLDAMKDTVRELGLLNENIQTFAEALGAYRSGQAAVDAAKADRIAAEGGTVTVRGFAAGGDFAGGLRAVGEDGVELEVTGPARIFSASQTADILGGAAAGASEVVAELQQLRAGLERNTKAIAMQSYRMARALEELRDHGIQILPAQSGEIPTVAVS